MLKNKAKEGFKVEFIPTEASKLNQIQYLYDPNKNTISFSLGTRLSFYLSVLLFSNSEKDKMNSSNEYKMGFQKYSKFIFDLFVSSIDLEQINVKELMLFKPTISLHIGKHDDPEYIFRYFICISNRISFLLKQDFDDSFKSLKTNLNFIPSFDKEDDFYKTFFDLKEFDISLIEDYELHPNDYIDEITLRISGKNRKIIKYKDNHKGRHLRRLHEKITLLLQICFPPSKYAFAYKKNSSTKKCVEQHISSQSFIKLDIHSFFNSISLHKISSLLKSRFEIEMEPNHRKVLPSTGEIEKILKCCFYHKKLPLGFVSSPILSDIFMNQTDIIIGERFDGLIYTRYADDILVSSREKCEDLSKCLNIIDDEINKLGLTINNKKKASVHFKNDGDSIHYLGINIVKRRNENELTISKRTLWNDAKKIHKEAKKDKPDYSKIKGIEQYIFEISPKSFDKLNKMYQSAFKTKLP